MFHFHTSLKKEKSPYLLPFSTEHTPISFFFLTHFQITIILMVKV